MVDVPRKSGRGFPPEEHRFKKGESGNPKGRPPKAAPTPEVVEAADILSRIKQTKVPVQSGESVREIPYLEALLNQLASAGLKNTRDGFRMLPLLMGQQNSMHVPHATFDEQHGSLLDDPIIKRQVEREVRRRLQQQSQRQAATALMRDQFGSSDEDDGSAGANDGAGGDEEGGDDGSGRGERR